MSEQTSTGRAMCAEETARNEQLEAENARYRAALLRIWAGDIGPAESAAQFAFWTVHPALAVGTDEEDRTDG